MCRMKILSLFLLILSVLPIYAAENKSGELLEAVEKGNLPEVKELVKNGADLNAHQEEEEGLTPLILAVRDGNLEIVNFLISAGADVNAQDKMNGATALMWASTPETGEEASGGKEIPEADRQRMVKTLIAAKANVNQKNSWGGTPLQWAVDAGEEEVIDLLLAAKADVNIKDNEDRTCLMAAANYEGDQYVRIVQKLLKAGAEINAIDVHGATPLMYATNNFKTANTEILLKAGADVNAADKMGFTVLMKAAQRDRIEIAKVLMKAGAKLDAKTQDGKSVMDVARAAGYKDMIQLLENSAAK
jgi:ankyrin repeat protein